MQKKSTHFGYQTVDWDEKEQKVAEVFQSVAKNYDLMNDFMSLGIHRLWKKFTVEIAKIKPSDKVLDLAGGSGDLTRLIYKHLGEQGEIILADINDAMLEQGRNRLLNEGICHNVSFVQANAECLPFASNYFDCMTMGFGLRNVTDKDSALASLYRVCKPGGKLMVLEFSEAIPAIKPFYDFYSFNILPKLGQWLAKDADSYQYLAESIRMHPAQDVLKSMIELAGFEDCHYYNLSGGIVALHIAYKY